MTHSCKMPFVIFAFGMLSSCAIQNPNRFGLHEKYAKSVMREIVDNKELSFTVIHNEAFSEVDSLIRAEFVGKFGAYFIYNTWAVIAEPPYTITEFGIDSTELERECHNSISTRNKKSNFYKICSGLKADSAEVSR